MIHSREELALAQRVVIKAGTSVVSTPEGFPSLSRMANIVENVPFYPNYQLSTSLNVSSHRLRS